MNIRKMGEDQQFCLRWNNHQSTLISVFDTLLESQTLVDCTLTAEGKIMKAHKVVLSACSPFFATLVQDHNDKHPIFILKDVKYQELRAIMDYMYRGEVNISQDQLPALLKTAESLQIKGLSDGRSGTAAPQPEQPRATMPTTSRLSPGYTLEQTKRARIAGQGESEIVSREGSSSPSRRRRKARRKSIDNSMADVHDNSNSSQQHQQIQSNASGLGAITAAASVLAAAAANVPNTSSLGSNIPLSASTSTAPGMTISSSKKTDNVKGTTQQNIQQLDAMNTENVQGPASANTATGSLDMQTTEATGAAATNATAADKSNHKQQKQAKDSINASSVSASELVIEPKAEYDDEANDEPVEDLTLDDEDMGMDDLDQNAGTSQGGEGSSQGYAPWQHDRSQDELLLATQETQQRDPQVKHDKSEQTDINPEEFELDDCLLESNNIVITQNKHGYILHVQKLGNITTAKLSSPDEDQVTAVAAVPEEHVQQTSAQITDIQEVPDVKPTFTTLTTSPAIKLPSSECELITLKKIIPSSTTISTHHPHATIIQTQQIQPAQLHQQQTQQIHEIIPHHHHQQQQQQHQQPQQQQHHHQQQQHHHQQQQQQQQQHQQHHQQPQHHQMQHNPQVQSIVTTTPTTTGSHSQTINLMGLRNVQITEQKPVISRIKYSRGKVITPTTGSVQIVQTHDPQTHEITDGTKYEISEIDLNNPQTSAAIISDLVKYAEIDDIELPDGTKIGIGFAPTEITEHMQTAGTSAQITTIEQDPNNQQHHQLQQVQQHHQLQAQVHLIQASPQHHQQQQQHHIVQQQQQQQTATTHVVHHQPLHLQEQDDNTTSVEAILPDGITVHEQPLITKSYTILTARSLKAESTQDINELAQTSATYELSLSDSSLGPNDDESKYVCRHCAKKYRWKSTLRRHENVECGGKEPCHPCPYCSYKAKQRGNLGVHVRKHHPDKPQLESKRGRKA